MSLIRHPGTWDAGRRRPALFAGRFACIALVAVLGLVFGPAATAVALPDDRAYELISKGDGNLGDVARVIGVSNDGSAVAYNMNGGTDISQSAFQVTNAISRRTSDGWTAEAADLPSPPHVGGLLRVNIPLAVSEDFQRVLIFTTGGVDPGDLDDIAADFYVVDVATNEIHWVTNGDTASDTDPNTFPLPAGYSSDLRHVFFQETNGSLLPGAPNLSIYEWEEGDPLRVASVDQAGTPVFPPELAANPDAYSGLQGTVTGGLVAGARHGGSHTVSDDGSVFYFTLKGVLYARHGGTTTVVSASQRTGSVGTALAGAFVGASHDGDLSYFVSPDQLTDASTPGGGLYSYRISTGQLTQLTPDANDPGGLGVKSALMSDDASHVYFIATAALTPAAQAGEPNLYVFSGGQTRFISTVPAETWLERASRSGQFAILRSTGSMAGADSAGHEVLYRYDEQADEFACVSCRVDGAPSAGDSTLQDRAAQAGGSGVRNIADDGTVFFASNDRLVPEDLTSAWDVYQYDENGPSLLTTGRSQYDSFIQDNSDDGTSVFFVTKSALLPSDTDGGLGDLYAARVGGGFPEPGPAPAECVEDECQGAMPAPAVASDPGTRTLRVPDRGATRPGRLLSVASRAERGSLTVLARVSGPGKLAVKGRAIRSADRAAPGKGAYRLEVSLRRFAQRALDRRGSLTVRLTVVFEPRNGKRSTRTVQAKLKA
jgi:hypothetical protein